MSWLRIRHPSLGNSHADLIQQATTDLLQWLTRASRKPDIDTISRIGFRILQRRVADAFRAPEWRWAALIDVLDSNDTRLGEADEQPPDVLAFTQLLKAISAVVSDLSAHERNLLFRVSPAAGAERRDPLTTSQRKRISRLRKKIRKLLHERHGIDLESRT